MSPEDPFWNWYRIDWNVKGLDYFAHEAPHFGRPSWRRGYWAYACLNSKSYFDYKVWGVNWYLNEMCKEAKDLYFDLANPHPCYNAYHGCAWTDDFGRKMYDTAAARLTSVRATRSSSNSNGGIDFGVVVLIYFTPFGSEQGAR